MLNINGNIVSMNGKINSSRRMLNSGSFNPYLCPFFDAAKADGKLIENIQKNCNFVQTLGKIYFRKNT